jgi:hypothetical protein
LQIDQTFEWGASRLKKGFKMKTDKIVVVLLAILSAAQIFAQQENSTDEEAAVEVAAKKPAARASFFTTLPLCRLVEGVAEVRIPGKDWRVAEEGKFYPLGTAYRTREGGVMEVSFGTECTARISGDSDFATYAQSLSAKSRTIVLGDGLLELSLAANLPEGAFVVTASNFTVKNPAGKSKFEHKRTGDGDLVIARCVTGSFAVDGRHFSIAKMRAADELKIRSTHDNLETILYGTSGDYVVTLDVGMVFENVIADDGSTKKVAKKKNLDWNLSPDTKVRIQRMLPAIGERMSVDVTTWDASGEKKNWWTYTEGRAEVNSGEQVAAPKSDSDELVKRAAEATETTAADVEEESAEEGGESSQSEENGDSSQSDEQAE